MCRRRSFHTVGNPLTGRSVGSFGISEGNITRRTHTHTHTHTRTHTQNMHLTAASSGKVAQTLASTTNKCGLDREAQAA